MTVDSERKLDREEVLKKALDYIVKLENKIKKEANSVSIAEPIAVVGMGCRFPGSTGVDQFWETLVKNIDTIEVVPKDRWSVDHFYDEDPEALGKSYSKWGGFLSNVDLFDEKFFNISPREAAFLDPQHRVLLEVAWEALETAGHAVEPFLGDRTGLYVGMTYSDYPYYRRRRTQCNRSPSSFRKFVKFCSRTYFSLSWNTRSINDC